MKIPISVTLILSLSLQPILPMYEAIATESSQAPESSETEESLVAQRGGNRGGGSRGGGSRGGGVSRSSRSGGSFNRSQVGASGSGRVQRNSASRPSGTRTVNRGNLNVDRNHSNRVAQDRNRGRTANVNRDQVRDRTANINRDQVQNRTANINRDQARNRIDNNRDFGLDNDRNFSNRVNRNIINTGSRNVVINPRGYSSWGWNRGVSWSPNVSYWGGGFWGPFAAGALLTGVTSAAINAAANNNNPTYVVIERDSPGYNLFSSYNLTQVECVDDGTLVFINGPQGSAVCARPNNMVAAGYYEVNPSDLTLVAYE